MRPSIYLVAPRNAWERISSENKDLFDELVEDPGLGLAAAINKGVQTMNASINVVGWLGDDDKMLPNAIESSLQILKARPLSVATFGDIEIIDKDGLKLRRMKARQSAPGLARFWTNHVYQPGSFVRRDSFVSINGLDGGFFGDRMFAVNDADRLVSERSPKLKPESFLRAFLRLTSPRFRIRQNPSEPQL
jgi:hypothetical protein